MSHHQCKGKPISRHYFQFAVPQDDISDSLANEALAYLADSEPKNDSARSLLVLMDSSPSRVLAKLRPLLESFACTNPAPLLEVLAEKYESLEFIEDQAVLGGPQFEARVLASDVLMRCPKEVRGRCLDLLSRNERIGFGADVAYSISQRQRPPEWLDNFVDILDAGLARAVEERFGASLQGVGDSEFRLLIRWNLLSRDEHVKMLIKAKIEDRSWKFVDLLPRLVGTKVMQGVGAPVYRLGDLDAEWVNRMVGMEAAIVYAGDLLDQKFLPLSAYESLDLNDETRLNYGLAFLAQVRVQTAVQAGVAAEG